MNRTALTLSAIATSTLLCACEALSSPIGPQPLPYRLLHASSACGTDEASVQRVTDRRELNRMATSPVLGATAPPSPDFETSLVLRVSMGQQPTAGSHLEVTGVRAVAADQRVVVHTLWSLPDPGRMQAMVVTRPCVIVAVEIKPDSPRSVQVRDQRGELRAEVTLRPTR